MAPRNKHHNQDAVHQSVPTKFGIRTLYPPSSGEDGAVVTFSHDIVAIHGMGAHPDETWCERVNRSGEEAMDVNWLCDPGMLPAIVPNARIMRYGYESQWYGDEAINLRVPTIAQNLLQSLCRERKSDPDRPLIFIAHCYGGLALIKAMVMAKQFEGEWPEIHKSTTGMLFLGTPFRGTQGMSQRDLLQAIQNQYDSDQVQASNLNILAPGNESLVDLLDDFMKIRREEDPARIACFWERKPSNVGALVNGPGRKKFVVDESSGCLDQSSTVDKYPLSRDHFRMNKFGDPASEDFLIVRDVIENFAERTPACITARSCCPTRAIHYTPGVRPFIGRTVELKEIERKLFVDRDCQKLALSGLGGVGKTSVALQLVHEVKKFWPYYSVFWVSAVSHETFERAYRDIAEKCSIALGPKDDLKVVVQRYLCSEAAGNWLLIVDNADDKNLMIGRANECDEQFLTGTPHRSRGLTTYLPESERGLTLFTTRYRDMAVALAESTVIELHEMSKEDALALLERSLTREILVENRKAAVQLLHELTYLPLAIIQAAAYINELQVSLPEYLSLLRNTEDDAIILMSEAFHDDMRYKQSTERGKFKNSVAATWLISFERIYRSNSHAADLLSFISCIEHKEIPHSILPALEPKARTTRAIGTLCAYAFITRRDDGSTYDMHRLVHLAAKVWLKHHDAGKGLYEKVAAQLALKLPSPHRYNRAIWRRLFPHAIRFLRNTQQQDIGPRYGLCKAVGSFVMTDRRPHDAIEWHQKQFSWSQKNLPEDDPARLDSQCDLASAFLLAGWSSKTIELLAPLHKMPEDQPKGILDIETRTRDCLAAAYKLKGYEQKATELLEPMALSEEKLILTQDGLARLGLWRSLADAYVSMRRVKDAITLLEADIETIQDLMERDRPIKELALMDNADAYLEEKQLGRSALQSTRKSLADAYLADGRRGEAIKMFKNAIAFEKGRCGEDVYDYLVSHQRLVDAYLIDGQWEKALALLEWVLATHSKAGYGIDSVFLSMQQDLGYLY